MNSIKHPKSFLLSKIEWSGDGETWKIISSSIVDGGLDFYIHDSKQTRLKGVYTPRDGKIALRPFISGIWMGKVTTSMQNKDGVVSWFPTSGPRIKWEGESGGEWVSANWSKLAIYGALIAAAT